MGDSKKSMKDFLAKSKGGVAAKKKKWSKGKVREKLNNAVCFDQATYDKMMKEAASWKLVTPSVLSERLKINGSLARRAIKELLNAGSLRLLTSTPASKSTPVTLVMMPKLVMLRRGI